MASHKPPKRAREQNSQDSEEDENIFITEPANNWIRYWIMEDSTTKLLEKLNPFIIQKSIEGIAKNINITRLRSGSLLLQCTEEKQATRLENTTTLAGVPVRVTPHKSLNYSKGIIKTQEAKTMTNTEMEQALANQGVTSAHKFTVRVGGEFRDTNTVLLTFDTPTTPTSIKFGYLRLRVEIFIPNPLRCFKCQRYGHGQSTCKGEAVCPNCGSKSHTQIQCNNQSKCANCGENHNCMSKTCPMWLQEKLIQKIKTEKRCSYGEARRIVFETTPKVLPRGTYASVLTKTNTIGTQTCEISTQTESPSDTVLASNQHSTDQNISNPDQSSMVQLPEKVNKNSIKITAQRSQSLPRDEAPETQKDILDPIPMEISPPSRGSGPAVSGPSNPGTKNSSKTSIPLSDRQKKAEKNLLFSHKNSNDSKAKIKSRVTGPTNGSVSSIRSNFK